MLALPLQTLVADGVRETRRAGGWSFLPPRRSRRVPAITRPLASRRPRRAGPASAARSVPGKETHDANSRLRHGDQPGARRRGPGGARGKSAPGRTAVPEDAEHLRRPGQAGAKRSLSPSRRTTERNHSVDTPVPAATSATVATVETVRNTLTGSANISTARAAVRSRKMPAHSQVAPWKKRCRPGWWVAGWR